MTSASPIITFDTFELDESNARLTRRGQPVELPPRTLSVLCHLARRPGQLVTKDDLLDGVWGHRHVSESVLKNTISQLRAALADDARQPRYIETVSRRGYRFLGQPLSATKAAATVEDDRVTMVGRGDSLDRLTAAWYAAIAGRRQIIWVVGEAGVGKTTLIDHFSGSLPSGTSARGQCIEQIGAGEPYLPALEALGELCRTDPALPAMIRSVAPTWLLQMPWLIDEADREGLQRETAGASQDRMLREMAELLDRYTQQRPLLLVIEDLHWGDHATVRLIDHLARRRSPARLMVLASFRPADLIAGDHPLKDLRHELRLHRLCREIPLDPFSEQDVAEYLAQRLHLPHVAEEFVRRLHSHTDGLPLFLANVVDDLILQGELPSEGAADLLPAPMPTTWSVPAGLAGIIEKQIDRLPPELRVVLETASVAGMEFRPEIVAAVLEKDVQWVRERCDGLVRHRYWLHDVAVGGLPGGCLDTCYGFRHALYRNVFYQRMSGSQRARLHRGVAQAMAQAPCFGLFFPAAERATHCELGHDYAGALKNYAAAAANALDMFAPTEARQLADQGLRLLSMCPQGQQRDELELALTLQRGLACSQLFGVAAPETKAAYERAQALCDSLPQTSERAWVLNGLGWVHYTRGDFEAALALGKRINTLAAEHDDRMLLVCACNLIGVTLVYQGALLPAIDWLQQGLTASEALGERLEQQRFIVDPAVSMLGNLIMPLTEIGQMERAMECMEAGMERAQKLGHPFSRMLMLWCSVWFYYRLEQPERMQEMALALGVLIETHDIAQGNGPSQWLLGWSQAHLGEPRAGFERIVNGHLHHTRVGMYAGGTHVIASAAQALILDKDWDGAAAQVAAGFALAQRIGERVGLVELGLLRAGVARCTGDLAGERAALSAALAEARTQHASWAETMVLVELCSRSDASNAEKSALRDALRRLPTKLDAPLLHRARNILA